jgi:hypothetical protein
VEPNEHWRPCHKRVPGVVIECVEAAILAAFLRHLRAALFSRQVVDVIRFETKSRSQAN